VLIPCTQGSADVAPRYEGRMHIISSGQLKRPFSLCCTGCDAGHGALYPEQAIAAGWSGIEEDFGGHSWNYLGTCSGCVGTAVPVDSSETELM